MSIFEQCGDVFNYAERPRSNISSRPRIVDIVPKIKFETSAPWPASRGTNLTLNNNMEMDSSPGLSNGQVKPS